MVAIVYLGSDPGSRKEGECDREGRREYALFSRDLLGTAQGNCRRGMFLCIVPQEGGETGCTPPSPHWRVISGKMYFPELLSVPVTSTPGVGSVS